MAELRRQHHLVAAALQRLAHQRLAQAGLAAVHVGGVEERDARVDRRVEDLDGAGERLGVRARAAEVVAAEADGRDEQAGRADATQGTELSGEVIAPR